MTAGVLAGVHLHPYDIQTAELRISDLIGQKQGSDVHLCNTYTLALARKNVQYRTIINSATINLVDGTPIAWMLRSQGNLIGGGPSVVRGPDLFERAILRGAIEGRHFLLGGNSDMVRTINERQLVVGVEPSGSFCPPYTNDVEEIIRLAIPEIVRDDPDVIWVGLGTPKQDYIASRLATRTSKVVIAVGAAFDFLSGQKPEAPARLRGTGFEWIFRLASEPRRLAPRYFYSARLIGGLAAERTTSWLRGGKQ